MKLLAQLLIFPLLVLLMPVMFVSAQEDEPAFSQAELDQMLAPIALYPDSLLSQILMGSTYPLEIVQAARWSRRHPDLDGKRAVETVEDRDWDPSVKALVAFPNVLARMDQNLEWTQDLGEAFLYQKDAVMATIQGLRERAYAAGHLDSLDYVRVYREPEVIIIEPAHHHVVYVPYYDPTVVYGSWWWSAYPPVHWAPPHRHYAHTGLFYWGSGISISAAFFFSSFDWHHHHVVVTDPHHHTPKPYFKPGIHFAKRAGYHRWRHVPHHRRGVAFRHHKLHPKHGHAGAHRHGPEKKPHGHVGVPAHTDRGKVLGAHTGLHADHRHHDRSFRRNRHHLDRHDTVRGTRLQRPATADRKDAKGEVKQRNIKPRVMQSHGRTRAGARFGNDRAARDAVRHKHEGRPHASHSRIEARRAVNQNRQVQQHNHPGIKSLSASQRRHPGIGSLHAGQRGHPGVSSLRAGQRGHSVGPARTGRSQQRSASSRNSSASSRGRAMEDRRSSSNNRGGGHFGRTNHSMRSHGASGRGSMSFR